MKLTRRKSRLTHSPNESLSLDQISARQNAMISHIDGGWSVRQRLNQLGLHVGDVVQVKRGCTFGGPILINNKNYDIGIGRGMAQKIKVKLLNAHYENT